MSPRLRDDPAPRSPKKKQGAPDWQRNLAANPTLVGWAIFLFLMLAGAVKFVVQLPTAQDRVVRQFFQSCQRGDYKTASSLCEGGRFSILGDNSLVRGTPGGAVSLAGLIADEPTIEEELRAAPLYVSGIRYVQLHTQREKNPDRKTVQFQIEFDVFPEARNPLGPAPSKIVPFTLDGHAIVVRQQSSWVIHALDFQIIPQKGADLLALLRLFRGQAPTSSEGP